MTIFLTAEWRYLLMLNFSVEPELLRPYVPRGTELDTWNGIAYLSVVGFLFLRTRVLRVPVPFHRNFEEINLRFYVRRRGPEGWRRGVVFLKEIVPRKAIAAVARLRYQEPYVALPMRHRLERENDTLRTGGAAEYGCYHQGRWHSIRATSVGAPHALARGSEAEFIAEHYWGYTARRDGRCSEYRVEHPPWRVWDAQEAALDCDVASLYGARFAQPLGVPPRSAFIAEGSPVTVHAAIL